MYTSTGLKTLKEIYLIESNRRGRQVKLRLLLKLFQYNWNNKIIKLQDGILYTSYRLVGTSVEDSDVLPFIAVKFLNILLNPPFMFATYQNSLLVHVSRDSCSFDLVWHLKYIIIQLDWNRFNKKWNLELSQGY